MPNDKVMTLEQVRNWHKQSMQAYNVDSAMYDMYSRLANAIDAHLIQHAEMVAKLRELQAMWRDPKITRGNSRVCATELDAILSADPTIANIGDSHE